MPFELINSEILMKGRAFTIRRDTMKTPTGGETKFDIVEHGGSVIIVPVDNDGNILFVKQYRHAAGIEMLELPAGTRDGDEPFEVCAAREIREETGMQAGKLTHIGSFYLAPGYSTEYMGVFLAEDLSHNPLEADDDEFLSVEKMPLQQVMDLVKSGKMPDAKTLAALMLAKSHLNVVLGKIGNKHKIKKIA